MVVHSRSKTPKNTSFLGSPSPQGSHSPNILGDTTRPGHVTCVLVWSKSDRRRLRKTLHKQTDKQTDTTKIMVTWPWTNESGKYCHRVPHSLSAICQSLTGHMWRHIVPVQVVITTTIFRPFFPGRPGWAGARRELLHFMVQGKINRGRHTDDPAGRHSIRTN